MTDPDRVVAHRGTWDGLDASARTAVVHRAAAVPAEVHAAVQDIERRILADGDAALRELAQELDGAELDDILVPRERLTEAWDGLEAEVQDALRTVRDNLARYHRATMPAAGRVDDGPGFSCTWRFDPLERAGLYVPGGRHPYPSTLLMAAIPAQVAEVGEIWVASPPTAAGDPHDAVLGAAHLLGIDHVVRAGGAQAIFALAHGTTSVPACDVVVGPGNAYVRAAKQHVAGRCRIDSPAGPSEVLVLADEHTDAQRVAWELIAQAEHGPGSVSMALVPDRHMAQRVADALIAAIDRIPTGTVAAEALAAHGAILEVADADAQVAIANQVAPEHLVVLRGDANTLGPRLRHAGCVFLGPNSGVPLGDYAAGPSHILPTGGAARAYAGLGVEAFVRRTNLVRVDRPVRKPLADAVATLAALEGLPGHVEAARQAQKEAPRRG